MDAARYFFLMRRGDSQLDFDVDLATSQTDENPVFYVQMAHARMSGIFRVAGVGARERGTGRATSSALPAPEDAELLKKLTAFPDMVVAGRARARAAPHHRLPRGTRARGARLVPQVPGPRRAAGHRAGAPRAGPRRAHRARQRPRASSASPPPTGCDRDEPARGRQRRARLDLHPVRRDRRRARRLGRVLQRRGRAAPPGAAWSAWSATTIRWRELERLAGSGHRLERGRARRRARASAGRASTPTTCRAARRWRPGSACSPTSSPGSRRRAWAPRVRLPRQHRPRAAARRARPGRRHPTLVVCDTMNYWIQRKKRDVLIELLRPRRHPDGQRHRGPRAVGRLEHPSGRALDPRPRPQARGHQAGRVRRAAARAGPDVLRPRLPARGSLRSHRRRRRVRRRLHGLPGPGRRRPTRCDLRRAMVYGATMGSFAVAEFGIKGFDGVTTRATSSSGCGPSTT